MGTGFLEAVYQECLGLEFASRGIPFAALPILPLSYKGLRLRTVYQPDFVCFGQIIVELKVVREIAPGRRAQVLNYLKGTGLRLGLLVNFGVAPLASAASRITMTGSCGLGCKRALFRTRAAHASYLFSY